MYIGPDYGPAEPPAAEDIQAFIKAFVAQRGSGGGAEQFLAESAHSAFHETDGDDRLDPGEGFLYPAGDISDSQVDLLEYGDGAWTVEMLLTIDPVADCPSFTVVERWRMGRAPAGEGVNGLAVIESEFLGSDEPICPAANDSGA